MQVFKTVLTALLETNLEGMVVTDQTLNVMLSLVMTKEECAELKIETVFLT